MPWTSASSVAYLLSSVTTSRFDLEGLCPLIHSTVSTELLMSDTLTAMVLADGECTVWSNIIALILR